MEVMLDWNHNVGIQQPIDHELTCPMTWDIFVVLLRQCRQIKRASAESYSWMAQCLEKRSHNTKNICKSSSWDRVLFTVDPEKSVEVSLQL